MWFTRPHSISSSMGTIHNQAIVSPHFLPSRPLLLSLLGPILFLGAPFLLLLCLSCLQIEAGAWLLQGQTRNVMAYLLFDFSSGPWGDTTLLLWPSFVAPQANGSIQPSKHPMACRYEILAITEVGRLGSGWKTFPIDHSRVWWTCLRKIDPTHWFFFYQRISWMQFKSQYFLPCTVFSSWRNCEASQPMRDTEKSCKSLLAPSGKGNCFYVKLVFKCKVSFVLGVLYPLINPLNQYSLPPRPSGPLHLLIEGFFFLEEQALRYSICFLSYCMESRI